MHDSAALNIGVHENTTSYKFEGRLFDFRYYNHAITATEISQIYHGLTIIGDEVLHLPLNDKTN